MDTQTPTQGAPTTKRSRKGIIIWLAALVVAFFFGITVGQGLDLHEELLSDNGNVEIRKVINLYSKTRSPEVDFQQFWTIWDRIQEKHVGEAGEEVDEVALFYGAIEGLVNGLNDPYSVYLPPEPAEQFAKDLAGEFEGIGAEIGIREGQLQIIAPLPGSPAENAGLLPGDPILAIDGADTAGMTIEEAVTLIRGEGGTVVVLTITHNGFETIENVEIVRDTINVPTVLYEFREDNIAYLRISHFNQDTWREFDQAVRELLVAAPSGVILDLRSNPGGFLETAVDVASEWVESGVILTEGAPDEEERAIFVSRGRHRLAHLPTVVLVDGGSASGSEIVAGALQDHDAATIIGSQTFGKGSVQDFEVFPDGSALKLTIAKWFTPDGRAIDGEGVAPDTIIEPPFEEVIDEETGELVDVVDLVLEHAVELLTP